MKTYKQILFDHHIRKYVRKMPFYMIRHFGVKEDYSIDDVNYVVKQYNFDANFSYIGYAMFCGDDAYEEASSDFVTLPGKSVLRRIIGNKYFHGREDYSLEDLMKLSFYKYEWSDDVGIPNEEYWQEVELFDDTVNEEISSLEESAETTGEKILRPEKYEVSDRTTSDKEWEAHFQSLDTDTLLNLLAPPSLLHRKMVEEILIKRGITPNDMSQEIERRKEEIEKQVSASESFHSESHRIWPLVIVLIILMVWGIYSIFEVNAVIYLAIGVLFGGITGYFGGLIGGWISGYFDPITRTVTMERHARYSLAKGGAESAAISGALAGVITGGVAGVVGNLVSPILLIVITAVVFWFVAARLEIAAGETIMGYPGGVILGAVLGIVGGFAGRYIATILFNYS